MSTNFPTGQQPTDGAAPDSQPIPDQNNNTTAPETGESAYVDLNGDGTNDTFKTDTGQSIDANNDGTNDRYEFDLDGDGYAETKTFDNDGDGRTDGSLEDVNGDGVPDMMYDNEGASTDPAGTTPTETGNTGGVGFEDLTND